MINLRFKYGPQALPRCPQRIQKRNRSFYFLLCSYNRSTIALASHIMCRVHVLSMLERCEPPAILCAHVMRH